MDAVVSGAISIEVTRSNFTRNGAIDNYGGAMYVSDPMVDGNHAIRFSECVFDDNGAFHRGGGMYLVSLLVLLIEKSSLLCQPGRI